MLRALFAKLHVILYRLLRGRLVGRWGKAPVLLLTTRGRRSVRLRTTPVLYLAESDVYAVVATNDGAPRDPGWFLNLAAHPQAEVEVGGKRIAVTAETATDDERTRLWPALRNIYPNYQRDQDRTDRQLPIVLLRRA